MLQDKTINSLRSRDEFRNYNRNRLIILLKGWEFHLNMSKRRRFKSNSVTKCRLKHPNLDLVPNGIFAYYTWGQEGEHGVVVYT